MEIPAGLTLHHTMIKIRTASGSESMTHFSGTQTVTVHEQYTNPLFHNIHLHKGHTYAKIKVMPMGTTMRMC